jgi:hypothetical protein
MQKDMGAVRSLGHVSHLRFGTPTVPEVKKTGLYLNVLVFYRPMHKPKKVGYHAKQIRFLGENLCWVLTRKPLIVNLSVNRENLSRGWLSVVLTSSIKLNHRFDGG